MSQRRILLVDDDRLVLATLGQGFRSAGYEVLEASSGEEAIAIAGKEALDLAVLDMRMPDQSGIAVARWLIEHTSTPFLFLSAYDDPDVVAQAIAEGALTYLVKPVEVSQIVPALEAALSRSQDLRSLRETEQQLNTALASNRYVSMAVGLLMERHRLPEQVAFERLRTFARSNRRKLGEVAEELVNALEQVNALGCLSESGQRAGREQ